MKTFKAFTLIELLVVIVIIGILATISTATYKNTIEKGHQAKSVSEYHNFDLEIKEDCILNDQNCGQNLVTNPHFGDGDDGWPITSAFSTDGSVLKKVSAGSTLNYITVPVALTGGSSYRVDVDIFNYTGTGDIGFSSSGGTPYPQNRLSGDGRLNFTFTYDSDPASLRIFARETNFATFDNMSVRELR